MIQPQQKLNQIAGKWYRDLPLSPFELPNLKTHLANRPINKKEKESEQYIERRKISFFVIDTLNTDVKTILYQLTQLQYVTVKKFKHFSKVICAPNYRMYEILGATSHYLKYIITTNDDNKDLVTFSIHQYQDGNDSIIRNNVGSLPDELSNTMIHYLSIQDKKRWASTSRKEADRIGRMLAIPNMPVHEKLAALELPANRALFEKEELLAMLEKVHNNTLLIHFMRDLPTGGWLVRDLEELIETRIATLNYQRNIKVLLIDHYIHYLQERRPFSRILRLLETIRSREVLSRLVAFLLRLPIDIPVATMNNLKTRVDVPIRELLEKKNNIL